MTGGLFDPLGVDPLDRLRPRPSAAVVLAALTLAGLGGLILVAWLRDDGDRGRPTAVAPIARSEAPPPAPPPPPSPPALPAPPAGPPGLPPVRADQEVEMQNGVRIVRPRRSAPTAGGSTIPVQPGR